MYFLFVSFLQINMVKFYISIDNNLEKIDNDLEKNIHFHNVYSFVKLQKNSNVI